MYNEPARNGLLRRRTRVLPGVFLAAALALGLGACASNGNAGFDDDYDDDFDLFGYEEPYDPLEPFNRAVFFFNDTIDGMILRPIALVYDGVVPSEMQDVVRNFARHLATPVVLTNDVLQGDWERAENTAARMFVNTMVLGLADLVPERHPHHSADFGQTLAIYGVGEGFYLVLPVLGPSTLRDGFGMGVDSVIHPLTFVDGTTTFRIGTAAAEGVDLRARNLETLDEIRRDAIDDYARIRSLFLQWRQAQIEKRDDDFNDIDAGF